MLACRHCSGSEEYRSVQEASRRFLFFRIHNRTWFQLAIPVLALASLSQQRFSPMSCRPSGLPTADLKATITLPRSVGLANTARAHCADAASGGT
jgi:hypothetical protein